jgi:hypothetical protein
MRPVTLNLLGIKDPQVSAALQEVQRASQDTLISDSSSPGAAMGTVPFPNDGSFAANTIAYFSQITPTIIMLFTAFTAFGRSLVGAVDAPTARGILGVGAGSGTVTSVAFTAGPGLKYTGTTPITTTGTATFQADGVWDNVRNAKTSAYVVSNTDKGNTIALGGSAFYVLTLNAASGYDANFVIAVVNEDTTRAKCISPNGVSSFYLWPLQTIFIYNDNNTWQIFGRSRWILPTSTTWNVNHASGSDSVTVSDGLGTGTGAFATIQNAWNIIQNQIDCNGLAPTILNVSSETFTESLGMREGLVGALQVFINGPSCVWQCGANSSCLNARDGAIAELQNFKLVSTGSGSTGIAVSQFGTVDVTGIEFGTFTGGYHIQCFDGGALNYTGGSYVVSGNMITHWWMQGMGHIEGPTGTISIPNVLTFTNFLQIIGPAYFQAAGVNFSGAGSGAGSTGQKYNISLNGVANTGGAIMPGATAGATSTGGQFA